MNMSQTEVPRRVMPGLVSYVNEYGFRVTAWHYSSDPAKRGTWADETASGIPGGRSSDHWRQEQEIDPFILRGKPTYYGFSHARNVVNALPVDLLEFREWTWFLSADFGSSGGATCWLFWAENPRTADLIIFDEVYVDEDSYGRGADRTPQAIKPLIYEKLRAHTGVSATQPFDFGRHVRYAVGDPSGLPFMQEYRKSPMAIPVFGGAPDLKVKLNDIPGGESRLNAYFSASFVCCPTPDNPEGRWYVNRGQCPRCGQERVGRPRLTILRTGAPHLISQLPTIRKKLPKAGQDVPAEGNVRVEDHAEAAARYGAMSRPVIKAAPQAPLDERPLREMVMADRFWESLQNRVEHTRLATLFDDPDERELALAGLAGRREEGDAMVGGPW